MKLEIFRHIFEKYSNIKFREDTPSGRQVITCGRTDRRVDGQTEGQNMTKLTVAFSQFCESAKKFKKKHGTALPSCAHTKV